LTVGMKIIKFIIMKLQILAKNELLCINGGVPDKHTTFAYDLFWGIAWGAREIWDSAVATFVDGCRS